VVPASGRTDAVVVVAAAAVGAGEAVAVAAVAAVAVEFVGWPVGDRSTY